MMAMCRLPLLSVVCMLPLVAHAEHRHSISAHQEKGFLRAIDDDLRGEVNRAISDALGGAHNFAKGHLGAVRVALSPMWKALAKDEHGRIDLRSLQYVVQRYMLHAYHLSIIGFEQGQNSNSSESKLMQMAPSFVKRAVDGDDSMRGFSLDDTVAMIALIEEMLVHPGSNMLSRVYTMKGYNVRELVSRENLQSALESYLIRWLLTDDSTSRDYLMFRSDHELVQSVDNWTDMTQLLAGHVQEFAYRNAKNYPSNARDGRWTPLKDSFSFADASEIVRRITMSFGEYWRSECVTVKESLVKLDRQRIGRVKLSDFHGAALNGEWRFSESVSYLRELGALDESSSLAGPRVIVANYLQGASNCIVSDQRYRVCCANDCETYMSEIEEAVAAPAASPEFLFEIVQKYGKIFMLQTGPVRQVWIGDPEVLRRVYECPECSGRPARYEDPFGNFLFLTREASAAAPIKEQQQAWLSANIRADAISLATDDAMEQLFPVLDGGGSVPWPADKVRTAMYSAVTRAILGDDAVLSSEELEELMSATREYSEMKRKSSARDSRLPPGAAEIKRIVGGALQRVGRADADQALPLIAAATIGGAEIFPTLLHWIFLKLAQHTEVLEAATEAALARDDAALMKTSYLVLRQTPYSVALGPPRRVMADVEVDGLQLPEGALLFAMHPALAGDTFAREDPDDFASYAFGVGSRACLGQKLTEALLPAAVGALLRRYKVVGLGAGPVRGVMKGQLIRPHDPPALVWERRG